VQRVVGQDRLQLFESSAPIGFVARGHPEAAKPSTRVMNAMRVPLGRREEVRAFAEEQFLRRDMPVYGVDQLKHRPGREHSAAIANALHHPLDLLQFGHDAAALLTVRLGPRVPRARWVRRLTSRPSRRIQPKMVIQPDSNKLRRSATRVTIFFVFHTSMLRRLVPRSTPAARRRSARRPSPRRDVRVSEPRDRNFGLRSPYY